MLQITIRPGQPEDIAPLDALFARSYPKLLAASYPPSVLVTAVPIIARAQPGLVTCGSYFVAYGAGALIGAGGWTRAKPGRTGAPAADHYMGHIRHFVTDADNVRQGIGSRLLAHTLADAAGKGVRDLHCMSTLGAVGFYEASGFKQQRPVDIQLGPGITFPAVAMRRGPDTCSG